MTTQIASVQSTVVAPAVKAYNCCACSAKAVVELFVVPGMMQLAKWLKVPFEKLTEADVMAAAHCPDCRRKLHKDFKAEYRFPLAAVLAEVAKLAEWREKEAERLKAKKLAEARQAHFPSREAIVKARTVPKGGVIISAEFEYAKPEPATRKRTSKKGDTFKARGCKRKSAAAKEQKSGKKGKGEKKGGKGKK